MTALSAPSLVFQSQSTNTNKDMHLIAVFVGCYCPYNTAVELLRKSKKEGSWYRHIVALWLKLKVQYHDLRIFPVTYAITMMDPHIKCSQCFN